MSSLKHIITLKLRFYNILQINYTNYNKNDKIVCFSSIIQSYNNLNFLFSVTIIFLFWDCCYFYHFNYNNITTIKKKN